MNARRIQAARLRPATDREGGFTLVELLVAMSLFLVLSGIVLSAVVALSKGLDTARETSKVSAEARVALERIAREVRQADKLTGPDALTGPTDSSVTVEVDFDGDNLIEDDVADPERVTYTFDSGSKSISMMAKDASGTPIAEDLLAGQVTSLTFSYYSSDWAKYPTGVMPMPVPVPEIPYVDQVAISLEVVRDAPRCRTTPLPAGCVENFKSHVTLRNRSQS